MQRKGNKKPRKQLDAYMYFNSPNGILTRGLSLHLLGNVTLIANDQRIHLSRQQRHHATRPEGTGSDDAVYD